MSRITEVAHSAAEFLKPGFDAISPLQMEAYDDSARTIVLEQHDSHVKIYKQDLKVEQAYAALDSALRTPLTNENASRVVAYRDSTAATLSRERAIRSELASR